MILFVLTQILVGMFCIKDILLFLSWISRKYGGNGIPEFEQFVFGGYGLTFCLITRPLISLVLHYIIFIRINLKKGFWILVLLMVFESIIYINLIHFRVDESVNLLLQLFHFSLLLWYSLIIVRNGYKDQFLKYSKLWGRINIYSPIIQIGVVFIQIFLGDLVKSDLMFPLIILFFGRLIFSSLVLIVLLHSSFRLIRAELFFKKKWALIPLSCINRYQSLF